MFKSRQTNLDTFRISIRTGIRTLSTDKLVRVNQADAWSALVLEMLAKQFPNAMLSMDVDIDRDEALKVELTSLTKSGAVDFDAAQVIEVVRYTANVAWVEAVK